MLMLSQSVRTTLTSVCSRIWCRGSQLAAQSWRVKGNTATRVRGMIGCISMGSRPTKNSRHVANDTYLKHKSTKFQCRTRPARFRIRSDRNSHASERPSTQTQTLALDEHKVNYVSRLILRYSGPPPVKGV